MTQKELFRLLGGKVSNGQVRILAHKPYMMRSMAHSASKFSKSFIGAFVTRQPRYIHVLDYISKALGTEDIKWNDFTRLNLRRISDYLNAHLAPNSAATYIHIIMALLNSYSEEGVLPTKAIKSTMRAKSVPSQHVALSPDELKRFDAYEPQSTAERDVKCLFMRACYTGARCSDAMLLSADNIIDGKYICYVSKKTSVESVLPLHKNLKKYLDYHITKEYSSKTTSEIVRRICEYIGMNDKVSLFVRGKLRSGEKWEFITMHSARRTFCTILAQMGVSVETIRTMAGHTTSSMTDRYICLDGRNPGADAMRFFQG